MMEKISGGVTAAKGFSAASAAAQIKYQGRTDMAMIYSASPCAAAGTFTRNVVKAAPVIWDRDLVRSGKPVHAVVVNSGIANACTGQTGLDPRTLSSWVPPELSAFSSPLTGSAQVLKPWRETSEKTWTTERMPQRPS